MEKSQSGSSSSNNSADGYEQLAESGNSHSYMQIIDVSDVSSVPYSAAYNAAGHVDVPPNDDYEYVDNGSSGYSLPTFELSISYIPLGATSDQANTNDIRPSVSNATPATSDEVTLYLTPTDIATHDNNDEGAGSLTLVGLS